MPGPLGGKTLAQAVRPDLRLLSHGVADDSLLERPWLLAAVGIRASARPCPRPGQRSLGSPLHPETPVPSRLRSARSGCGRRARLAAARAGGLWLLPRFCGPPRPILPAGASRATASPLRLVEPWRAPGGGGRQRSLAKCFRVGPVRFARIGWGRLPSRHASSPRGALWEACRLTRHWS